LNAGIAFLEVAFAQHLHPVHGLVIVTGVVVKQIKPFHLRFVGQLEDFRQRRMPPSSV